MASERSPVIDGCEISMADEWYQRNGGVGNAKKPVLSTEATNKLVKKKKRQNQLSQNSNPINKKTYKKSAMRRVLNKENAKFQLKSIAKSHVSKNI